MNRDRKTYEVNGVRVSLIRHEAGARWECHQCGNDCAHILMAAAWMTVHSWTGDDDCREIGIDCPGHERLTASTIPFSIPNAGAQNMAELLAFTAEHVCRLTGLSSRQLHYWDATDFFSPTLIGNQPRRAFHRIYTFRDVVGLRVIALLRKQHGIPLQELRRVGEWLHVHYETPWSSLRFGLAGRRVVFSDPDTRAFVEPYGPGQMVVPIALEPIASDMRQAAERLKERQSDEIGRIVRNRYVVHNAWVLAGTRIPTAAVWNYHEAGFDSSVILKEFPRLTERDIRAAIEFETERRRAA